MDHPTAPAGLVLAALAGLALPAPAGSDGSSTST
jgi:hypothetical protein